MSTGDGVCNYKANRRISPLLKPELSSITTTNGTLLILVDTIDSNQMNTQVVCCYDVIYRNTTVLVLDKFDIGLWKLISSRFFYIKKKTVSRSLACLNIGICNTILTKLFNKFKHIFNIK